MNNGENSSSKIGCFGIAIIILVIIGLIGSCSNNSSSSKYNSRYSYDYNTDKSYRDDVNDIAEAFGEDPDVVDRKIQDAVDAINN